MPNMTDCGHHRSDTDRGLLRDKVACPDPAAAPAHTDAEASNAPTPAVAALAALTEQRAIVEPIRRQSLPSFGAFPRRDAAGLPDGSWTLAGVVAGLVALGVAAAVVGL